MTLFKQAIEGQNWMKVHGGNLDLTGGDLHFHYFFTTAL